VSGLQVAAYSGASTKGGIKTFTFRLSSENMQQQVERGHFGGCLKQSKLIFDFSFFSKNSTGGALHNWVCIRIGGSPSEIQGSHTARFCALLRESGWRVRPSSRNEVKKSLWMT
jgi:hypothetical protein